LQRTVLVREQLAFALNRRAPREPKRMDYRDRAIVILKEVIAQNGPNAETGGLLGRIYKDRWQESLAAGQKIEARGHLRQAIDAYVTGFRSDCRDSYPGINAATLLDIEGSKASSELKDQILPVVRFAVDQRIRGGNSDYWDHATVIESEVLAGNENPAMDALAESLSRVRETWEPETTARNLNYIYTARMERGVETAWLKAIIDELLNAAKAKS
jgi:hypothetical protein